MDGSLGFATGNGGLLRRQPRGLCVPACGQHLPQPRLASTDPRDVVERVPGRPRRSLKGSLASSALSITGSCCYAPLCAQVAIRSGSTGYTPEPPSFESAYV